MFNQYPLKLLVFSILSRPFSFIDWSSLTSTTGNNSILSVLIFKHTCLPFHFMRASSYFLRCRPIQNLFRPTNISNFISMYCSIFLNFLLSTIRFLFNFRFLSFVNSTFCIIYKLLFTLSNSSNFISLFFYDLSPFSFTR